jgi:F-type H+-transporting ATPase subunit b
MAAGGPLAMLISQILAFAVLAVVIGKLVLPALRKILGGRTQGIEETFRKIEQDTAETARLLGEFRQKLADVEAEARRRLERSLADAQKTRDQVLADSAAQVQAAAEKARREVQIERDKAVLELREAATDLTLQAADHVVRAAMNDAVQGRLVESYLARLDSVKP